MTLKDLSTVSTTINAPIAQAFDYITQARFWPVWHPLSAATTGVTERPFLPGDKFSEFGRSNGATVAITWEVREHNRPTGAVIATSDLGGEFTITYNLEEVDATTTRYTRTVAADETAQALTAAKGIDVNDGGEGIAVANLKALVENLFRREGHQ